MTKFRKELLTKLTPNNKLKRIFIILFLILTTYSINAQRSYYMKTFVDAEFFLLYEEYESALPLYKEILKTDPDNANINYRIGQCLIHLETDKISAIPYLEKVTDKISSNYREGYYSENRAPIEAYLYLGRAYRINNDLDKAYTVFKEYKKALMKKRGNLKIVEKELEAIDNARKQISNPIQFIAENLGSRINTSFPNLNAVVSGDESTIVYVSKLKFYNGIFMSKKENGFWSIPKNITSDLLANGEVNTLYLSRDGNLLLIARNDNDDFNIYQSRYNKSKDKWSEIEKLSKDINTRYKESHACLSPDGNTIFFSSNKPGGYGGLDIYYSQKNEKGDWQSPVNLGKPINTSYDETCPYLTENIQELYFSSKGHNTMGGYDIFHCFVVNDGFSDPVNIGYPINSTDDDIFFVPFRNGLNAYYSFFNQNDGYGKDDIYKLSFDLANSYNLANRVLEDGTPFKGFNGINNSVITSINETVSEKNSLTQ